MQPDQEGNYWQNLTDEQGLAEGTPEVSAPQSADLATQSLSWTASEYVQSEKSALWTMAVIGFAAILVAIAIFLIDSWSFAALAVVMAITLIIMGRRPPRMIPYLLTPSSLKIDEKSYALHDFRAFGVVREGAFYSIRLIPMKRFMPAISLYFPPDMGEGIVDNLATSLPMQQIKPDLVDKFLERIHF